MTNDYLSWCCQLFDCSLFFHSPSTHHYLHLPYLFDAYLGIHISHHFVLLFFFSFILFICTLMTFPAPIANFREWTPKLFLSFTLSSLIFMLYHHQNKTIILRYYSRHKSIPLGVEIQSISNPLCVFKNYGGSKSEYFCASPQRYWSRFFGDRIIRRWI